MSLQPAPFIEGESDESFGSDSDDFSGGGGSRDTSNNSGQNPMALNVVSPSTSQTHIAAQEGHTPTNPFENNYVQEEEEELVDDGVDPRAVQHQIDGDDDDDSDDDDANVWLKNVEENAKAAAEIARAVAREEVRGQHAAATAAAPVNLDDPVEEEMDLDAAVLAAAAAEAESSDDERVAESEARAADERARAQELAAVRVLEAAAAEEEAARLSEERAAEEEAARLSEERAAVEEAARLSEERAAEEEAARLSEERAAEEEAARLSEERAAEEEAARMEAELAAAEERERERHAEAAAAAAEEDRLSEERIRAELASARAAEARLAEEEAAAELALREAKEAAARASAEADELTQRALDAHEENMHKPTAVTDEDSNLPQHDTAPSAADDIAADDIAAIEAETRERITQEREQRRLLAAEQAVREVEEARKIREQELGAAAAAAVAATAAADARHSYASCTSRDDIHDDGFEDVDLPVHTAGYDADDDAARRGRGHVDDTARKSHSTMDPNSGSQRSLGNKPGGEAAEEWDEVALSPPDAATGASAPKIGIAAKSKKPAPQASGKSVISAVAAAITNGKNGSNNAAPSVPASGHNGGVVGNDRSERARITVQAPTAALLTKRVDDLVHHCSRSGITVNTLRPSGPSKPPPPHVTRVEIVVPAQARAQFQGFAMLLAGLPRDSPASATAPAKRGKGGFFGLFGGGGGSDSSTNSRSGATGAGAGAGGGGGGGGGGAAASSNPHQTAPSLSTQSPVAATAVAAHRDVPLIAGDGTGTPEGQQALSTPSPTAAVIARAAAEMTAAADAAARPRTSTAVKTGAVAVKPAAAAATSADGAAAETTTSRHESEMGPSGAPAPLARFGVYGLTIHASFTLLVTGLRARDLPPPSTLHWYVAELSVPGQQTVKSQGSYDGVWDEVFRLQCASTQAVLVVKVSEPHTFRADRDVATACVNVGPLFTPSGKRSFAGTVPFHRSGTANALSKEAAPMPSTAALHIELAASAPIEFYAFNARVSPVGAYDLIDASGRPVLRVAAVSPTEIHIYGPNGEKHGIARSLGWGEGGAGRNALVGLFDKEGHFATISCLLHQQNGQGLSVKSVSVVATTWALRDLPQLETKVVDENAPIDGIDGAEFEVARVSIPTKEAPTGVWASAGKFTYAKAAKAALSTSIRSYEFGGTVPVGEDPMRCILTGAGVALLDSMWRLPSL